MPLLWLYFGEGGCAAAALVFSAIISLQVFFGHIMFIEHKYTSRKNHDRHTDNEHTCILGSLNMLPCIVPNLSEKAHSNHIWRHKTLWHIHKKNANCANHKWRPISHKNGKIFSFECDCRYRFTQKQPLLYVKLKTAV